MKKNYLFTENFSLCPTCGGKGQNKLGLACPTCAGLGRGVAQEGVFYVWKLNLNYPNICLASLKRKLNLLIDLSAFLFGLTGLIFLAWWLWSIGLKYEGFNPLLIWQAKHENLLIFWLSVFADMFVAYRIGEDKSLKQKIVNKFAAVKDHRTRVDVAAGLSFKALRIVDRAYLLARRLKHEQVGPLHLFYCSLDNSTVQAFWGRLSVNPEVLIGKIKNQLYAIPQSTNAPALSDELRRALVEAYIGAGNLGQARVEPINFLLPLAALDKTLEEVLYDIEVDLDKINNVVAWFRISQKMSDNYKKYKHMARFKPGGAMDKAYTAVATPALNSLGYDLTAAAKWFRLEFCVAREKEFEEIFAALESGKNGILLTGEVGVGKRTMIHGLAQLMVEEEVPKILQDKRLIELDVSRLVSGATPSEAQERLLVILDEAARARNIVLFISNIEKIVGISAGSEESSNLSDVLVNALEHYGLICFASATRENYLKFIEGNPLGNAMANIEIEEPAGNQAIVIIESRIGYFEGLYKIYFSYNAIEEVVKLTAKYIHDKFLPAKALEVLESLAVKAGKDKHNDKFISKEDVAVILSEVTGIPMTKVGSDEGRELLNLEDRIHEHMIDQVEAVNMVAASLRRARAQLSESKRPIASFLFLGPTGVGKTELAKSVAKVYFGDENCMVRLDMSEYQTQDSIVKMIGDESNKGYLTEAVRRAPFCLLLLDEFEKAHPDILNLFLQVMDDGRLTDGQGRTIDFTNCIIIATSNAGALFIQEKILSGVGIDAIKEALINEHLNKVMRPELINRFDGVIVFKPLSQDDVIAIAKLMLNKTAKTLGDKGISLHCDEAGVIELAHLGFDPKFGARPLRRLLQDRVDNVIANKILAGELKRRDTVVINAEAQIEVEKGREL